MKKKRIITSIYVLAIVALTVGLFMEAMFTCKFTLQNYM